MSLHGQVDPLRTLVVATCDEPIRAEEVPGVRVLRYHGDWNISRWWNLGLDFAAAAEGGGEHEVLVLNADATVGVGTVSALRFALHFHQLAISAPDVHSVSRNGCTVIHRELVPLPKIESLPGYCFMVRGELDLRCDTRFKGWYNEDDLEWQARRVGGVGLVPNAVVHHADGGFGAAEAETGLRLFKERWGSVPWV